MMKPCIRQMDPASAKKMFLSDKPQIYAGTRHPGYAISLRIRKRIEETFCWAKTVAGLRKARHRGLPRIDGQFTFAMAAYNLIRLFAASSFAL